MSAGEWQGLTEEIARWREARLPLRLWLRDDDAIAPTPALERLIALARRHRVPILLAVIPALAGPALAARLAEEPLLSPCQHGVAHVNHAGAGDKKAELGARRPLDAVLAELAAGRGRMRARFGPRALPVLVPPWNRVAREVVDRLPGLGFAALSAFGPPLVAAPPGLASINCHLDIVNWREDRASFPQAVLTARLATLLGEARMRGGGPVGILLHHLVHDENAWTWLDKLCARVGAETDDAWARATEFYTGS